MSIIAGSNSTDNSLNVMDKNSTTNFIVKGDGNIGIGTTSPTHKLTVVGDVFVDGTMAAREFYTDIVSSSIQFTSGSTKFGDTTDDTHQFTGSVKLD